MHYLFQITLVLVCVTGVLCQTTKAAECVSNMTEKKFRNLQIDNTMYISYDTLRVSFFFSFFLAEFKRVTQYNIVANRYNIE
jgi:hypothetical protein